MAEIQLVNSDLMTLVDDEDFPFLSRFSWSASKGGNTFYALGKVCGLTLSIHRLVMNAKAGMLIDHRNMNGLDNRKENLRFATRAQNAANRRGPPGRHSSYIGVTQKIYKGKLCWAAATSKGGGYKIHGYYSTEVRAALARDRFAFELYGEFAVFNFPNRRRPIRK